MSNCLLGADLKRSILTGEKKVFPRQQHLIGPPIPLAEGETPLTETPASGEEAGESFDSTPLIISIIIIIASSVAWYCLRRREPDTHSQTSVAGHPPAIIPPAIFPCKPLELPAMPTSAPADAVVAEPDIRQYEDHLQAVIAARRSAAANAANMSMPDPRLGALPAAPPPPATAPPPLALPAGDGSSSTCQYF